MDFDFFLGIQSDLNLDRFDLGVICFDFHLDLGLDLGLDYNLEAS